MEARSAAATFPAEPSIAAEAGATALRQPRPRLSMGSGRHKKRGSEPTWQPKTMPERAISWRAALDAEDFAAGIHKPGRKTAHDISRSPERAGSTKNRWRTGRTGQRLPAAMLATYTGPR